MTELIKKKFKVHGRIRADIPVSEIINASTEENAVEKAINKMCKKCGIYPGGYIDDEIYCEEINLDNELTTIKSKYEKLLQFVRQVSYYIDSQNPHHTIQCAENLLKEIEEL